MNISIREHMTEAAQLFAGMDSAYDEAARRWGFHCQGCEENCCRSLFYHHTAAEFFWLRSGLVLLPVDRQEQIRLRAAKVLGQMKMSEKQAGLVQERPMCPLNEAGRCVLYANRPMICRLHGVPHELALPDGRLHKGPGCDAFYRQCQKTAEQGLDRTPWYAAMAGLEQKVRKTIGFKHRIKMTIAQMLVEEPQDLEIH